ncbi:MAG: hypothetical protein ACYDCQ_08640 [Dehalococcoidia bacterium]
MRRFLNRCLVLGTAVVALTAIVVAHAQTPTTITMVATTDPALSGTVVVTPAGPNQVKVVETVKGFKPNEARVTHIHSPGSGTGACDSGGPIVYPLTNITADASGTGTSTTTVTFDPAKGIPTAKWYFNVHAGTVAKPGAGVICGLITAPLAAAPAGATATRAATPAAGAAAAPPAAAQPGGLPKTGGQTPTALMLGLLALAGLALTGTGMVVARRRS